MLRILSILLSFASLALCSCDSAVSPGDTNPSIDTSGFAMLAVTTDTLYYGDQAWVDVNNMGLDLSELSLFIHTTKVEAMQIDGKRLYFTIPVGSRSGKLRLYKYDTLLAKNEFSLSILQRSISDFRPKVRGIDPTEGYAGQTIHILVDDLPWLRRQFDVMLDDTKLEITDWDTAQVVARIPNTTGEGMLSIRVFDTVLTIGKFKILPHGGRFLDDGRVNQVTLRGIGLLGQTVTKTITDDQTQIVTLPVAEFYTSVSLSNHATVVRGDSVFIKSSSTSSERNQKIDIALLPSPDRNTVSGRVTLEVVINPGMETEGRQRTTVMLKDIHWKEIGGQHILLIRGKQVAEHVKNVAHESTYRFGGGDMITQTITDYTGAEINSYFEIYLLQ